MWTNFFTFLILVVLFSNPSTSDPQISIFSEITEYVDKSKKNIANCLSDDIKLLSPWNKKHKILDLRSCNDSLDVITTKLPAMLSDLETCFMIVIRGNTTDKVMEAKLIDILEEQATHPTILDFYNEIMKSENSYIIDNRKTKADNIHTLDYVKNFLSNFYENTENQNLKDVINNSCSLCIHFAQLFDIYFHILEDQIDDLKYDADCFKALLDLPHSFVFNNSYDNVYDLFHGFTINLMTKVYWKGANLEGNKTLETMYSSIKGRVNYDGFTALAMKNREYQVFEFLIRADFEFPKNFLQDPQNNLSSNENVEKYIQKLNDFHKSILNGDVKKIKQFLSSNSHLTFARNLDNKSALKAALDSNQMEVFSYLKSQGMNFASLQEYAEYCKAKKEFNDKKKVQLRQYNLKFLESAVELDVVTKMMQKSSFVFNHHLIDIKTVREAIKEVYEYIETIVPELLNIAAASNELRVVFDFVNSDLNEFDPSHENSLGSADDELDLIMIGAKQLLSEVETTRIFIIGTLSHELMHYVMTQVYENGLNPYGRRDFERKMIFVEIFNKYKEMNHKYGIISSAYENYDDEYKYCELIARVLQILTTYHNQTKLEEIKETYIDLFNFFDQYVLADMREFIPTMHTREKVRELNSWLDLVAEIESYEVENAKEEETDDEDDENKIDGKKVEEEEQEDEEELPEITEIQEYLDEDSQQRLKVIKSENPKLILQKLYYKLRKSKTIAIYVASSFSKSKKFESIFSKIDTIHPSVPLIINCDRVKRLKKFVKMLQKTTFRKVVAIAGENEETRDVMRWIEKIEL